MTTYRNQWGELVVGDQAMTRDEAEREAQYDLPDCSEVCQLPEEPGCGEAGRCPR